MKRTLALVLFLGFARADFISSDTTPAMPAEKSDIPGSTCGADPNHLRCAWTFNQLRAIWLARKPYVVNWEARVSKLKDPGQPGVAPYSGPGWATGGLTLPTPMGGRSCANALTCLDAATYNGLLAEVTDLAPYGADLEARIAALEAGSVAASSSPGYATDFLRANTPGGLPLVAAKTANVTACPGVTATCMDRDAFNAARAAGIDVRAHLVTLRADVAALEAPVIPGIYVATTGNDTTGDGTIASPYATPGKAQTVARAIIAAGLPANGLTIILRGGVYPIASTMAFTAADSGAAGQLVTWKAYPSEEVRISGGVAVGSWTQMSAGSPDSPVTGAWNRTHTSTRTGGAGGGSKIWWASIPGTWPLGSMSDWNHGYGIEYTRPALATFSYKGEGQLISQYPKRQAWNARYSQWGNGSCSSGSISYSGTTEPTSAAWATAVGLPSADRPWILYLYDAAYATKIRRLNSVSGAQFSFGSYDSGSADCSGTTRWQAYNMLEEVTAAGEFYIDRTNRVVYFLSPESGFGTPGGDARVSRMQSPLSTFAGAHHMVFDGIIWEDAQKDAIEFDPGVGSNRANTNAAPSHDIVIQNGGVRNTGAHGIIVRGSYHTIDRMTIHAIGAAGVEFRAAALNSYFDPTNASTDSLSTRCTLRNSEIYDTVRLTGPSDDGPAAVVMGGKSNTVTHNYLHDNRSTAVYVISRSGQAVTYNRLLRNATERSDGGVVYQCRFQASGLEVAYNIFAFLPASSVAGTGVYAAYADDGTAGWNVHHNIFYAIGGSTYGAGDGYSGGIGALVIKGASSFSDNVFSLVKYARYYGAGSASGSAWKRSQGDTTSPATNLQNSGATDWANPPSQSGETWTGAGTSAQAAVGFLSVDPDDPAFLTNNADGTLHVASAAGSGNIPINQIGITAP